MMLLLKLRAPGCSIQSKRETGVSEARQWDSEQLRNFFADRRCCSRISKSIEIVNWKFKLPCRSVKTCSRLLEGKDKEELSSGSHVHAVWRINFSNSCYT